MKKENPISYSTFMGKGKAPKLHQDKKSKNIKDVSCEEAIQSIQNAVEKSKCVYTWRELPQSKF